MLCRLRGGFWEGVLSFVVSSSFRYGFWSNSFVLLCTYSSCFVVCFCTCFSVIMSSWKFVILLCIKSSVYSSFFWVLLKLWNCILWNVLRKKTSLWNRMFVKRFEKMCILIFLSWYEMCETILWKNVWRKELWELSYVEIANMWKDCGLNVLFYLKFHETLV